MVTERLFRGRVLAEALTFTVIIVIHPLPVPVVMALYTEVVVTLDSKFRQAVSGFQEPLRKRYAGRHTATVHFLYRQGSELFYVYLLRRLLIMLSIG